MAEIILNMLIKKLSVKPDNSVMLELAQDANKTQKVNLLQEAEVINRSEKGAFHYIFEIRDKYVHGVPRYVEAEKEAKKMLKKAFVLLKNKFIAIKLPKGVKIVRQQVSQ